MAQPAPERIWTQRRSMQEISGWDGMHPTVAALLASRGVTAAQAARYLEKPVADLPDPTQIAGMDVAAARLADAIRKREKILIHGDYDVDGTCAAAILVRFLHHLRHQEVEVFIPDRIEDGYGLSEGSLAGARERAPQLFITVDCGTADKGFAKRISTETGADVIITDHHQQDHVLPECLAVVNPNLASSDRKLGMLCGAGIAWCLAVQTARTLVGSRKVTDQDRACLMRLLQLAAIATVADCVPMIGPNRVLVHHGLIQANERPYPGVKALVERMQLRQVGAYECGWRIGPVLNACGRLGSALRSFVMMSGEESEELDGVIEEAVEENEKRKALTDQIVREALLQVEQRGVGHAIVAAGDWHQGIVGIVAGRLMERFHRPTCVLGQTDDPQVRKGSLRTIDGFAIGDFVIGSVHGGLLLGGGGHPKAAGCTIRAEGVDAFREAFEAAVGTAFNGQVPPPSESYDLAVPLDQLNDAAFLAIERLGPFGQENPEPKILLQRVRLAGEPRPIGRSGDHVRGVLAAGQVQRPFLGFNLRGTLADLRHGSIIDCIAKPEVDRFRGAETGAFKLVALKVVHPAGTAAA